MENNAKCMPTPPKRVGREFVRQYYTIMKQSPENLHSLYHEKAKFIHDDVNPAERRTLMADGKKAIRDIMIERSPNFKHTSTKINTVDTIETLDEGLLVQVYGEISYNEQPIRSFSQTIILIPKSPFQYFVQNDIFRFCDFEPFEPESGNNMITGQTMSSIQADWGTQCEDIEPYDEQTENQTEPRVDSDRGDIVAHENEVKLDTSDSDRSSKAEKAIMYMQSHNLKSILKESKSITKESVMKRGAPSPTENEESIESDVKPVEGINRTQLFRDSCILTIGNVINPNIAFDDAKRDEIETSENDRAQESVDTLNASKSDDNSSGKVRYRKRKDKRRVKNEMSKDKSLDESIEKVETNHSTENNDSIEATINRNESVTHENTVEKTPVDKPCKSSTSQSQCTNEQETPKAMPEIKTYADLAKAGKAEWINELAPLVRRSSRTTNEAHNGQKLNDDSDNEKLSESTSRSSDLKPSMEWSRYYFCEYLRMKILRIIEEVIAEILDGKEYSIKEVSEWCRQIVNEINRRIKDIKIPRYKHIVQIMLGEQTGAGCRYIARCHWDANSDNKVSQTYHSESMFCIVTVFACGPLPIFGIEHRKHLCMKYIRENVGTSQILMLVSGSVESIVCAALLTHALNPNQIHAVHIDNGFLRKDESKEVKESLNRLGLDIIVKSCFYKFFKATTTVRKANSTYHTETPMLCLAINPEEKRKIIGDTFLKIANETMCELDLDPKDVFLAQGTLRPDLIESASELVSKNADNIKTHHNDTELVCQLRAAGRVVEPLKEFQKNELRQLGRDLGLPDALLDRNPFPNPGLAIRILCASEPHMEKDFAETQVIARLIVKYYSKSQKNHALLNRVTNATSPTEQAALEEISKKIKITATLLPIRSIGVRGDYKSYSYVLGLSTENTPDWKDMLFLAKLIPRILHNINRVCYIFGGPVQFTINDITETKINKYSLAQLRQADHLANSILHTSDCMSKISQMPVVLIPIHFDRDPVNRIPSCARSIVLRPFDTNDFMIGVPIVPGSDKLPQTVIDKMVQQIIRIGGITRVLYDLTSNPPGIAEWE